MRRRLGATTDVRFDATIEECMQRYRKVGLNHIELTAEYLHGYPNVPSHTEIGELADAYELTLTYHAPFRDWNFGSFNDDIARAGAEQVNATLDAAATAGAGAVVVHGGSVPQRYPDRVREKGARNARESLATCARHAADVGVPLCLENQPGHPRRDRHTTSPDALASMLDAVDVGPEWLRVTLDVGHTMVNDTDWRDYVARFGDRITVCHLHQNDGGRDAHDPITEYEELLEVVDAEYSIFEMKSIEDVATCLGVDA
jgi:sugar phosphate isomerase/epimerase